MKRESSSDLKYAYTFKGLSILTNRPVTLPPSPSNIRANMQIIFTRKKLETYEADYWSDPDESAAIWHHLPETEGAPASFRDDGHIILISEPFAGFVDYATELRRVVPFAAALQGMIILHASAICSTDGAAAFIGASGVGKSTLRKFMSTKGFVTVADDLLLCQIDENNVTVPIPEKSKSKPIDLPLIAIYFLSRDDFLEDPGCEQISKRDTFLCLLRHGFGELHTEKAWRTLFLGYYEIAQRVPAFQLTLPNNIDRLDKAAESFRNHLSTRQLTIHGYTITEIKSEEPGQ